MTLFACPQGPRLIVSSTVALIDVVLCGSSLGTLRPRGRRVESGGIRDGSAIGAKARPATATATATVANGQGEIGALTGQHYNSLRKVAA